ncbi:unnamed protein product [Diplocarpon coronariae]
MPPSWCILTRAALPAQCEKARIRAADGEKRVDDRVERLQSPEKRVDAPGSTQSLRVQQLPASVACSRPADVIIICSPLKSARPACSALRGCRARRNPPAANEPANSMRC